MSRLAKSLAAVAICLIAFTAGFFLANTRDGAQPKARQRTGAPAAGPGRGALARQGLVPSGGGKTSQGRFRAARLDDETSIELDESQLEAMRAIGYEAGTREAPGRSGVTLYDRDLAAPGINLVVDGHDATAALIDMEGSTLHEWRLVFDEVFPDNELPEIMRQSVTFWRRAHVLEDGSLLAIFEGVSLIKIDRDSNLLWSYPKAHHDLEVTADGRTFVLTRDWLKFPKPSRRRGTITDYIAVLDSEGRELDRVSVYEAIQQSPYSALLENTDSGIEMFHTNTIEVLDGSLAERIPAFARGNVLISLLRQDAIAVIDMESRRVVWALAGIWRKQHQPTVTDGGFLMVFDNIGNRGRTRVIEIDPVTQQVEWVFDGGEAGLLSLTCGSNQRLANGNTLITESDAGRAIEVTRDKKIVWEYLTPHRAGAENELIATLFEVVRLPPDFPTDWLSG